VRRGARTNTAPPGIMFADVLAAGSIYYELPVARFLTTSRKFVISHKRQTIMYVARKTTRLSLPDIGRRFGGRDHTTVLHAIRRVEERLAHPDPEVSVKLTAAVSAIATIAAEVASRRRQRVTGYWLEHDDGPPPELLDAYLTAMAED